MINEELLHFDTLQVHAGQIPDPVTLSRTVPLYMSSSYVFRSAEHGANLFALKEFGNIYTRLQNPTTDVFEKRVAALNGGVAALATASGHSAQLIAITNIAKCGDNFISSPFLYGGTYNQFKHTFASFGIECKFTKDINPESFAELIDENTKAIYVESISNSNFCIADFEALAKVAHDNGIPFIVDNTFGACGALCKPISWGADIIVESATKWIGGHGTAMGGVITDAGKFDWNNGKFPMISEPSHSYHGIVMSESFGNLAFIIRCRVEGMRDLGPCASPFNSFLLIQGLETLSLRVEREAQNAMKLAEYFDSHPMVESVNYPGLKNHESHEKAQKYLTNGYGCILSITLKGDKEKAIKFVDSLTLVSHVANVGDTKTLIIQPAATTHQQLSAEDLNRAGIAETMLRISVGIEHIDDLKRDFETAFEAIKSC